MAVDGGIRHKLHASAKRALGDQEGDALMELLPPIGWDDFATKQDLQALKHELVGELHKAINAGITSQTKTFVWANIAMLMTMAALFVALVGVTR